MMSSTDFKETLKNSLVQKGHNEFRAALIAHFVTQCYELLLSSHQSLIEPIRWDQFRSKRGAKTTRLKRTSIPANISETAISADLSIEANVLLSKRSKFNWFVPAVNISNVASDVTDASNVATGSSSKRPDMVFFPTDPGLLLQFSIEAKIIRKEIDISNDLLGADGFGCYIRALDPYQSNGVVGLLGYVEHKQDQTMLKKTESCMKKDSRFCAVKEEYLEVKTEECNQLLNAVFGQVLNQVPAVCIANMLAFDLTV